MEKFSERLRDALQKAGVTQKRLAALLKEQGSTVSRWCTGSRVPSLDQAVTIARLLDVSLDDLIEGELAAIQPVADLGPEDHLILDLVHRLGYEEAFARLALAPPRPAAVESPMRPAPPVDLTPEVEGPTLEDDLAVEERVVPASRPGGGRRRRPRRGRGFELVVAVDPEVDGLVAHTGAATNPVKLANLELMRPVDEAEPIVDEFRERLRKADRMFKQDEAAIVRAVSKAVLTLRVMGRQALPSEVLEAFVYYEPALGDSGVQDVEDWVLTYARLRQPNHSHTWAAMNYAEAMRAAAQMMAVTPRP